uniref:Nadh dehydrogenase n=1 Tax=Tetraselmis sp. GSL018 TaxID=582737 RepID=A0A061R0H5_9CHLO|eukprot:CAMPEP_0177609132 /NCGR_PEP_ID=MMETSP0419_2-20121207/18898_1 /TAXON_ID=582737 /ORGANISM="Tetraselmis sp., Strain GSL018" /LENGTH=129 /DNA_ID=CAMNT_0019103981 /DNA_START=1 /DNA_END=390 /DNA_ORIENTATION=+
MSSLARNLSGLQGLSRRVVSAAAPIRGGSGGPVPCGRVATEPLPEQDEWIWDDGTYNPEPCLDVNTTVSQASALWMLGTGMGLFYGVCKLAQHVDKPSWNPAAPRQFPYDNLSEELGGDNGLETCSKNH